ncbi:MAG: hypothetical protein ACPGSB_05940, partial [Opitutales bacterium]
SLQGEGATDGLGLVVVLCERSVMAVESNGVFFHHFVARELLTPPTGLALEAAVQAPLEFEIDVADLRERLAKGLPSLYRPTDEENPPFIDARQLFAVAFVQRKEDSAILAAEALRLTEAP